MSILPFIVEGATYILVIYGFAGISTLFITRKSNRQSLTDILYSGFILYLVFFIIIRWLQLPRDILLTLLSISLLTGCILLIQYLSKNTKYIKEIVIIFLVLLLIYLGFYLVPFIIFGIDQQHYAMDMASAMNLDWIQNHENILGAGSKDFFINIHHYNRAGVSALGWLNNLSNVSINGGTVQRHILFYFAFTIIQFFQIALIKTKKIANIKNLQLLPFLLVLMGENYLLSLNIGQLNAAMGLFLLISIVLEIVLLNQESWKWLDSWRLCLLVFLLLTSYTEIILMMPLFVIVAFFWFSEIRMGSFFKTLIPLSLGILITVIFKFSLFNNYLLNQGKAVVGYYPLGDNFSPTFFNILGIITSSYSSTPYGISILVILITMLIVFNICFLKNILKSTVNNKGIAIFHLCLLWLALIYYTVIASTAISMTTNKNYMVFKLSSWTAPLIAIGLYIFWCRIAQIDKIKNIKILTFILIICLSIFSGYNSVNFLLTAFKDYHTQPIVSFVQDTENIELRNRPDLAYGQTAPLYDPAWVLNLAAWKNIAVTFKGNSNN